MKYSISPDFMRRWEEAAFQQGTPSLDLMERAAEGIIHGLKKMAEQQSIARFSALRLLFACGPGNNGGDGYAAARLAHALGARVHVVSALPPTTRDAKINHARCIDMGIPFIQAEDISFAAYDVLIDALFGTGFSRPPEGGVEALMHGMNGASLPVLVVDIPSGIDGRTGKAPGAYIKATMTVTFHLPKHGLLLTQKEVGQPITWDIGLESSLMPARSDPEDMLCYAEGKDLPNLLPSRPAKSNKATFGRVLMLVGSRGMMGAAAMAALACLQAGAGLTTIVCDKELMPIAQTLVPNATCATFDEAKTLPYDVLVVGCGLKQSEENWQRILALYDADKPSVWDADALNMLSTRPLVLGKHAVMTPHPGEAARLLNTGVQQVVDDAVSAAKALHQRYGCSVALKNATTVLFDGQSLALNTAGTPALSKGGSGDALCGILAGIMAQQRGREHLRAMQAATLWLGASGQHAEGIYGPYSVLTQEVIEAMGPALQTYRKQ